jgi:hypothetical protein
MTLIIIQGKLSRSEMKNIIAGSVTPECGEPCGAKLKGFVQLILVADVCKDVLQKFSTFLTRFGTVSPVPRLYHFLFIKFIS